LSGHSAPFYCPYCGEEDIVPASPDVEASAGSGGAGHGRWVCRACTRAFQLHLLTPAERRAGTGAAAGTSIAASP
jgi:transposase-like protein